MDWRLVYSWVVKYSTSFKQQKALSSNNYYTGNAVSGQCKYEGNLMKSSYSIGKSSFLQPPFILTLLYRLITAYCFKFDCNITNLPLALIIAGVIAKKITETFLHICFIFKQSILLFQCILPPWEVSQLFDLPQSFAWCLFFG